MTDTKPVSDERLAQLLDSATRLEIDEYVSVYTELQNYRASKADMSGSAIRRLFDAAEEEAERAMRKFPQPNYVISKVAEEAGEVVKAAIHCAEGRDTHAHLVEEIRQAMAMLIRLYVEGDQVHSLSSPLAALSSESQSQ